MSMNEIKELNYQSSDLKALSKHPEMQIASQNFIALSKTLVFAKAEVKDKFPLIIEFRLRSKSFTFFTF